MAPATDRAGVIVGLIGRSLDLICEALPGKMILLFAIGVAVSIAGSLEEVDERFASEKGEPLEAEAAARAASEPALKGSDADGEAVAAELACCVFCSTGAFVVGLRADAGAWLFVGEVRSCRGITAWRASTAFTTERHKQTFKRVRRKSISKGSELFTASKNHQCYLNQQRARITSREPLLRRRRQHQPSDSMSKTWKQPRAVVIAGT